MVNVPSGWCLKHPRYRVQVQLRGQNWDFTFLAQAPTKPHFCSSTIQWLLEKVYQVYHFHSMSYHFIAFFITIHFISFHVIYIHPFLQISTLILFNSQLLQGSCGQTCDTKHWSTPRPRLGWNLRVRQGDFEKNYVAVSDTSPMNKVSLESKCFRKFLFLK